MNGVGKAFKVREKDENIHFSQRLFRRERRYIPRLYVDSLYGMQYGNSAQPIFAYL